MKLCNGCGTPDICGKLSECPVDKGSGASACSAGEYLLRVFRALRFSKAHHKGMGDIQISMGKQEEIAALVDEFLKQKNSEDDA